MKLLKIWLRRLVNHFGFDGWRVGQGSLGRNHLIDIRVLSPSGINIIFDVGANVGQTALDFAEAFPSAVIYSFEPFPDAYQQLRANVRANANIIPQNAALGASNHSATLHISEASDLNSLLHPTPNADAIFSLNTDESKTTCSAQVLTVDDFAREHGIERIDLLKIDTQGYELHVLRGALASLTRHAIGTIFLEVTFVPLYHGQPTFGELAEYLEQFGYRFVGFYRQVFAKESYLLWADAIFAYVGERRCS